MKTLEQAIEIHDQFRKDSSMSIDDRFGVRLAEFLPKEDLHRIGLTLKEGAEWTPKPFTEENVLAQLKADVEFGWQKACDHRGISSNLMFDVVRAWCKVLDNEFADWDEESYGDYGTPLFLSVSKKYGFGLNAEDFILGD